MPAPSTVADFLDVCRKSGVVDENHLSGISGPAAATPVTAAKALIRKGVLTKFQAGQLLAGKYRGLRFDRLKILDKIGSGGMGTVFLCEHLGLRKKVAVKVLPPDQAGDEGVRERFFREARAAAALDHPNIVRVHDMASSGGVHYIVMEYVEGQDLQSVLNKYGALPSGRACNYIAQAALGLQHAHEKGLVHRDIKPANLLVDKEGVVKILDLGLATFAEKKDDQDNLTARFDTGAVLGTADYMAPEQVLNSTAVDIRADIYSLGVTLYALVNGKPPFGGSCTQKLMGHTTIKPTSLTEIRRDIPKGLSVVVDKMMAKNPDERYQTPAEVVEVLNPWLEADTIPLDAQQTRKMPGTMRSGKRLGPKKKSKMPLIVGAVAASALVFGGLGAWALSGGSGDGGPTKVSASDTAPPAVAAQKQPPKTGNPPKPNPPTNAASAAHDEARLVYEIDFSKVPAFMATYEHKDRVGMEGAFPTGWTGQSWRPEAKGDVGIREHNGSRGVAVRTTHGDGASAELQTVTGASPYQFVEGRRYLLRTEYANVGTQSGSFEVRWDNEHPPVKTSVQLKPTSGDWQTADIRFTAPPHERATTYFTHYRGIYPDYLVVRSVRLFEFADGSVPAAAANPVLAFEEDFSKSPPFHGTMHKPGGLKMQTGRLPDLWYCFVWKQGAAGDVAQEEFAGKKGVAIRTTAGDACAEVTSHTDGASRGRVKAGHRYRVDVEYAAPSSAGGRCDVRFDDMSKPGADQAKFHQTGNAWQTASLNFTVPADKDRPLCLYLVNYSAGADHPLYVHTVKLYDLTPDPNAPAAPVAVAPKPTGYRLDLATAKPFAWRYKKDNRTDSQGDGSLPAPWAAHTIQADTVGDVFVDAVGGHPALGLRNDQGPPSVELFCKSGLVEAKAGKKYAVRLTYQTEANAKGGCQVLVGGDEAGGTGFAPSVGAWKDVELTVTATADGPLTMTITCGSVGSEASVFIKSIEISEVN